jgi:septal ring factor EnvC (AmiA/AmiB activator)
MANGTDLDEIRAILAEVARSQAQTQQIVASTARAVEANSNAIAELRASLAETRAGIDDAVSMITAEAERNDAQHEDFRSFMRGLQIEMRRIWERITGNGEAGEA